MQPLHFPEETNVLAKAQPQYRVLPISIAYENPVTETGTMRMTCKYELSDLELQQIIRTKSFYISQYGDCFHPIYPQVDNPFLVCKVVYKINDDGTYNLWIPTGDKEEITLTGISLNLVLDEILNQATHLTVEQILFFPKPTLQVDGDGNLNFI
jgi:hypothetical protein